MISLGGVSIRRSLPGALLLCLLPLLLLLGFGHHRNDRQHLQDAFRERATAVAAAMEQLLVGGPSSSLEQMLVRFKAFPDVSRVLLVAPGGKILSASDPAWRGRDLATLFPVLAAGFDARSASSVLLLKDQQRVVAFQALSDDNVAPPETPWLLLEFDLSHAWRQLEQHNASQTLITGLALFSVILLLWYLLEQLIARHLSRLRDAAKRVALGRDSGPLQLGGSLEMVEVAGAFNQMCEQLRARQQAEQLQRRLYAALSGANQTIVRARDAEELLEQTSKAAASAGFRLVWIGRMDHRGELRLAASAGPLAFWLQGMLGEHRLALDPLATAVRAGKETILPVDAGGSASSWESEACMHGLAAGAAFPLKDGGELLGGLVVMSDRPEAFDDQVLAMLREMAGDLAFGLTHLKNETTRTRMERRLGEERALLRALIDSIPDLIVFKDHAHIYLGCNRAFERLVGHKESELLGGNEADLFNQEQAMQSRVQDERVLRTGKESRSEEWVVYPDGRRVLLDTLRTPFRSPDGAVLGLIGIARDITQMYEQTEQRLRLEQQLSQTQKMEAVGQLTGGIAHDFNNILASVLGFADLARRQQDTSRDKLRAYLERIYLAARRGSDLVAQLLIFSRGGSTDASLPLEPAPMVKETLKLLRATLPAGIKLETHIAPDLPQILMDPVHLNQVLMNLCINARDALGESGEIRVSLTLRGALSGDCAACGQSFAGEWVELAVADNGPGIAPEQRERLFEPFYTTKPEDKGTGMGLSVVHGILNSYGGHVLLESTPGKGACFRLLYPPHNGASSVAQSAVRSLELGEAAALKRKRVLVVDDEPSITIFLKEFLELQGLQVEAYTDSRQALQRLQSASKAFDLLITDQAMPELNGLDLVRQAKQTLPDLPVILCSGYSIGISAENAADHQVDHYLDKPVNADALLQAMHACLENAR